MSPASNPNGVAARRTRSGKTPLGLYALSVVGTSRCDVPARVAAGGTVSGNLAAKGGMVAPLHAARTAQRAIPTMPNRYQSAATVVFNDLPAAWAIRLGAKRSSR
jgi:hypothetical protein